MKDTSNYVMHILEIFGIQFTKSSKIISDIISITKDMKINDHDKIDDEILSNISVKLMDIYK